jgi:hypothetical protein
LAPAVIWAVTRYDVSRPGIDCFASCFARIGALHAASLALAAELSIATPLSATASALGASAG